MSNISAKYLELPGKKNTYKKGEKRIYLHYVNFETIVVFSFNITQEVDVIITEMLFPVIVQTKT
jgi:hypothetical protein